MLNEMRYPEWDPEQRKGIGKNEGNKNKAWHLVNSNESLLAH